MPLMLHELHCQPKKHKNKRNVVDASANASKLLLNDDIITRSTNNLSNFLDLEHLRIVLDNQLQQHRFPLSHCYRLRLYW